MSNALKGVILFTAIEVVGLVVWLVLAGLPFRGGYAAVLVLTAFLFAEHYVAVTPQPEVYFAGAQTTLKERWYEQPAVAGIAPLVTLTNTLNTPSVYYTAANVVTPT